MADVNATFNYDANFGSALSQIKALSKELSVLNNSFNSLDKNARVLRNDIANTFSSAAGQIGGFSSKTVTITSDLDSFGKALDRSKLKLRDYYREAGRAFSANSNARKLAEDQVRRTKGQLVELGMDAEGRRKGILVTPMKLDMTDMNNQLQVARKQFDIFNRLIQDGATSLINWGKNTQWAGRQLTVGLTVPMTIFASTTIKAFNDVDRELTRFQKVYGADLVGATKQASMEMRNTIQAVAIDIAKSYGVAAKETAALAADLAATGLEGKKLVDSVKQTSRLAVLGELERQDAMQTTLSLQNAFNMSTKELAESIDFLNAVENQTSVSLQDLTTAIPKVGPVVEALGGNVKDLSVLLVAMKEGGINAAEGANALKSGLASLINPTKAGSAVAKQYGIDLEGIVKRNKGQLMPTILEFQSSLQTLDDFGKAKIIEQLFGKYQFARISALFDNLNAQGSQTVEVMKLMGASSEELAKIADSEIKTLTESTSMRFQRAMEGIKASLLPVGETITRAVIPFMEKFANFMERVIEIGKGLPEPVKNFLKFAAGLTAIAGPVVMITGVLANFLGYVTKGAMGFVNLGRRLAGLPTKQFSLLDDEQIAAAKATDTLTVSIQNQASAMTKLVALMRDYNATLIAQRSATPGAFTQTPLVRSPGKGKPPIRRQQGSWVPGSGSGDKVKALLEPGEFVVNRNAAKQYGGVLEDMNNGTPRFQSGGPLRAALGVSVPFRRVPGVGTMATPGSNAPRVMRNSQSSRQGEKVSDFKDWNPREVSALSAGENLLMNNLFVKANRPQTKQARDSILKRIQEDDVLNSEQKQILLDTLSRGENIKDLSLQKEFSRILQKGFDNGDFSGISDALRAQMLTTIELSNVRTSASRTYSEINPALTETIRKHRSEYGQKIRTRPSEWSGEDTSKSFYSGFSSKDDVLVAYSRVIKRLKDSGVSDTEAERLANLYVYGIKRNTSAESFQAAHQSGGIIRAIRGVQMPESYATKLSTVRQSMSKANAEAMASKLPIADLGTRQSRIGGFSSAIPGVNGVYEIGGQRYVVKGHDTYESAKAEADMARITRDVFGLRTPNQEVVRIKHPETGELLFAVRSPYDEAFAKTTGRFTEDSAFDQLVASVVRRDKDLQADNLFDDIVSDVGAAGIMSKASQPRTKTGPTNSALEQLAINLGMTKGGARSHGAEAWNAATANMTDAQIIAKIKESAAKAKAKLSGADIPDDFKYIAQDLDDIASADLAPFVAHLRTVFPKEKKPPTELSLAKKAQQKELDRAERESAIAAGYPSWALQEGGSPFVPGTGNGDRIPALLEPGEFVVNKKAAKKYGGLLHDINFNQAPRFMAGRSVRKKNKGRSSFDLAKTPSAPSQQAEVEEELMPMPMLTSDMRQSSGMSGMSGMKTGAVSGAAMAIGMVTSMAGLSPAINNVIMGFSALTGVMSAFQMIMMKNNATGAAGGAGNLLQRGAAKRAGGAAAISGRAPMAAASGTARAGQIAGGVGRLAMGALMSGPGIALVAAVALATAAWIKYKKEVEQARKATEQAYSVGEKTAQAYGFELSKLTDKLKENAEITKQIGINSKEATSSIIVDEEKKKAILEDNLDLINEIKEREKTLSVTTNVGQVGQRPPGSGYGDYQVAPVNTTTGNSDSSQYIKSQLITKFASLRQQGVSQEDANEIIRVIAMEAGDQTISTLLDLKPTLEKMNTDNLNEVFKVAQESQLSSLKSMATGGVGGGEAFKEAIQNSLDIVQYAPPEDQLAALNNLINNMKDFSADQVVLAGQALAEAAAIAYGTKSGIGESLQTLFKSGDMNKIALGTEIDTLLKSQALSTNQQLKIQVAVAEGDIAKVNSIIDPILKDRNLKINMTVEMQKNAQDRIDQINKEISAQQAIFDGQMVANDNAIEAENIRYENAQKAHEKFIKQKQDEIEAINKSADAYIKALQDEQRADDFANQQRDTAVGGLKSLAGGDVFGFVQSQQEMAGAAQDFGFESEIKAIDERRQAAVDAKQEEIKKEQELAATEDERHQNRLKALEAQRVAQIQANGDIMKGFQSQQAALEQISGMSGTAFSGITEGFATVDIEANKVGASAAAVNYLLANPKATVEQAIAEGRKYMESKAQNPGEKFTSVGGSYSNKKTISSDSPKYASGGYISGAGGPKADLIPARLSNGEYVVQASAVDRYGVGMMESINEQRFADGGIVLDPSTKSKISIAEKEWGENFNVIKGGYLKADGFSGSTHTGGGVFDAYYSGGSKLFPVAAVKALRKAGFAAWNRWQFGENNKHIHAIEIGNPKLSKSAAAQVRSYLRGEDGLGGKDTLSNDYKIDSASTGVIPDEVAPNLDKIATAMGTTAEIYNQVKNDGVASLIGRRFGGSMTMNKPYMVGENGPEVVMPYGSGGKVVPIKYNVPAMASGGIINGSMASGSPQINVTVNGVNDPKQAADRAAQLINSEMNRRKFSRSIG